MGAKKKEWTPWYHGLKPGTHYRAVFLGTKIEECLPEARNPNCTICHPGIAEELEEAEGL